MTNYVSRERACCSAVLTQVSRAHNKEKDKDAEYRQYDAGNGNDCFFLFRLLPEFQPESLRSGLTYLARQRRLESVIVFICLFIYFLGALCPRPGSG